MCLNPCHKWLEYVGRWFSDFPVGRVIQVKTEGFLSPEVYPKAGVPQGSNLSPLFSWSMSMTCQILLTIRLTSRNLQMAQSPTAIRAEPALSLYGDLLSYYPQIKFLGITFDNRMDFHKTLWGNFRMLQPKISLFKNIGQQKVGSKSRNPFANLHTMCKTNIWIWDCFCHNSFGNCHHQNQERIACQNTKSPEIFH